MYKIISIITLLFLNLNFLFAQDFKCIDCHENPSIILSADHDEVKLFSECSDCHNEDMDSLSLNIFVHALHINSTEDLLTENTCLDCHPSNQKDEIILSLSKDLVVPASDLIYFSDSYNTWLNSNKLAFAHKKKNIGCSNCHNDYSYDEIDNMGEVCKTCHGTNAEVGNKYPETKFETNPHLSHYPDISCLSCHSTHYEFRDYCKQCHEFGFKWELKP